MRAITYVLITLSCIFAINVFVAASSSSYRAFLQEMKWNAFPTLAPKWKPKPEEVRTERLIRSIDRLGETFQAVELARVQNSATGSLSGSLVTTSGSTLSGATMSGVILTPKPPKMFPIPGSLLAQLMPQFVPIKIENDGIFWLKKLDVLEYQTYMDRKKKLKVYVFDVNYDVAKLNFRRTSATFKMNEADTFNGFTFFLNAIKPDQTVRFVTVIDGKAIGFEFPKKSYNIIKKLLITK